MADLYDIAASGMAAQRTQMDLIAQNLANAGVARADGSVYRPKSAVFESARAFEPALFDATPAANQFSFGDDGEAGSFGSDPDPRIALVSDTDLALDGPSPDDSRGGVVVAGIVDDGRAPRYHYDPGNPFAPKTGAHKGYVAMADVDPIQQMVALVASGRAYDADVSMLQAAKQMDLEAADIDRS